MDPLSSSDLKSEGKTALLAFFLGAAALFLEFYDASIRASSSGTGSELEYVQHKAHSVVYVFADIFWIAAAILFSYAMISFVWKRGLSSELRLNAVAGLFSGFFVFMMGKAIHVSPSFFLKEMEPQIDVLTGAIYSDLTLLYHVVMSMNMLALVLLGLAYIAIGHSFLKSEKADKMLGFFMEVTGVFAFITVAIFVLRSFDAVSSLNFIGLVGNASYNLFHFLLLLTFYKWGTFMMGIKLNVFNTEGGFDGKEEG